MARLPALPYVRSGVTEGLSANASYRNYQSTAKENGLTGMRRQDYLRMYSQTINSREGVLDAMNAPKDLPAGGLPLKPRDTIQATGIGHWIGIHQRTRGQSDYIFTPFLVKSNTPMTPGEAEARALDYLQQAPDVYDRITLGVVYMGAEQFTPKRGQYG